MGQLDQVTQTNAATSTQASSAASELSNQTEMLRLSVARLVAIVSGGQASEGAELTRLVAFEGASRQETADSSKTHSKAA